MRMLKLTALSAVIGMAIASQAMATGYEVWVSDQTNSAGISGAAPTGTHGGFLRVFDGVDLDTQTNPAHTALDTAVLWPNALASTGSNAIRIHGMIPSPNHNYMAVSFVTSGHLGIVDARTKAPVALFRTTGTAAGNLDGAGAAITGSTASGRQNHLTLWSPDGKYMLISNQNGKMFERVNVTWNAVGSITSAVFDAAASLDMVGGASRISAQPVADASLPLGSVAGIVSTQSTMTPNGQHKQNALTRPNNAPICAVVAGDNRTALVTLAGGGMLVVDYTASPMRIVAEYDKTNISAAGCGGAESGGFIYVNSGVYASNVASFALYRLPTNWPSAPLYYPVNFPKAKVVYQDADHGLSFPATNAIAGNNRDAHGFGLNGNRTYLHQFDRVKNNVEVFHTGTGQRSTYWLTTTDGLAPNLSNASTACGTTAGASVSTSNPLVLDPAGTPVYNDPSPDLLDLSPHGNRFYVALRGPKPLTISHAASGSCPGLGVVELAPGGKSGVMTHVIPLTWLDNAGTTNLSDPHAAVVRIKD